MLSRSLACGWRLTPAGHVRDVTLLPGTRVWWLSPDFDRVERPMAVKLAGKVDVRLHGTDDCMVIKGRELHVTRESANAALARRRANDIKRGRRHSCPKCFLRVGIEAKPRGKLWCPGCHHGWTPTTAPVATARQLAALLVAHPTCRLSGRAGVKVPLAIGMEVRVRGRGGRLFYVEAITDDDMLLSADADGTWELHAPAADLISTGRAEEASE